MILTSVSCDGCHSTLVMALFRKVHWMWLTELLVSITHTVAKNKYWIHIIINFFMLVTDPWSCNTGLRPLTLLKNDWWTWVRVKWTVTQKLEGGVRENFWIYVHGANSHGRPRLPHYPGFTITLGHTTIGSTPLDEWSALRPPPDKAHHSLQIGSHAPAGIRTHNSSKRAAAHPRLRPRGQWESIGFEPFI